MKYESSFCAANGTGSRRSSTHDFGFNTWNTALTPHTTYTMLSCSDKEKQGQVDGSLNYKYILNISIPLFQHSINLILDSSQASCPIIMFWILINTIINYARDETLSTSTFKLEYNLVVAGCWAALTKSSSVTRPKPTSLMSNDCQCKPPHYLRFKLCTVQDIGLPDDGLGHGGGHFIMKMWRAADISVTSSWHLRDILLQRSVINWSKLQPLISWLTSCHRWAAPLTQHVGKFTTVPASICPLQFSPITDHGATFISGPGVRVSPATITRPARLNILNISVAPRHAAPRSHPPAVARLWP